MQTYAPGRVRILVMDPNERVRNALVRRLAEESAVQSAHALESTDPQEVNAALDAHDPHVVLIDPRGGCREVLDVILARRNGSKRFVLAIHVAYGDEAEEAELTSSKPALYVLKGLKTAQLLARLREAAGRDLPPSRWDL
jgi:DNA-binding NarL/FixJ family response regulator